MSVVALPQLIEGAVLVESHADRHGNAAAVHLLYVPLRLDGRLNRVKLIVRESGTGTRRHYAVDYMEIAEPRRYTAPAGDNAGQSPEGVASALPAAQRGSTIKLGDLLRGVKHDDETAVFAILPPPRPQSVPLRRPAARRSVTRRRHRRRTRGAPLPPEHIALQRHDRAAG